MAHALRTVIEVRLCRRQVLLKRSGATNEHFKKSFGMFSRECLIGRMITVKRPKFGVTELKRPTDRSSVARR